MPERRRQRAWPGAAPTRAARRRQEEVGLWGHEYVRNIAGEIGQEYAARREADAPVDDLLELVAQIVPYHMSHNAGAAPGPQRPRSTLSMLPRSAPAAGARRARAAPPCAASARARAPSAWGGGGASANCSCRS